jgi:HD-GYP domain-containing protein (c-di-GMP phosphodiesterase class II)
VKRAVQSIVDQVLTNETSIFGLTTLRDYDEYTFTHSVNVCIFSVALGKKLGFDKHQLYELGLGALMHDVGKAKMPTS